MALFFYTGRAFEWIVDVDLAHVNPCTYPSVSQRFALATFYYWTKGYGWIGHSNWLSVGEECSWEGVVCNDNVTVSSLELSYYELPGSFPPEIKALSSTNALEINADIIDGGPPIVFNQQPYLDKYNVNLRLKGTGKPTISNDMPTEIPTMEEDHSAANSSLSHLFRHGFLTVLCTICFAW